MPDEAREEEARAEEARVEEACIEEVLRTEAAAVRGAAASCSEAVASAVLVGMAREALKAAARGRGAVPKVGTTLLLGVAAVGMMVDAAGLDEVEVLLPKASRLGVRDGRATSSAWI